MILGQPEFCHLRACVCVCLRLCVEVHSWLNVLALNFLLNIISLLDTSESDQI